MSNLEQRNQLLYEITNHKKGKTSIVCAGYTNNIISTLTCQSTRDFLIHYASAFIAKTMRIPFVANDIEIFTNRDNHSLDVYRRKTPFKESMALDYKDLDHIATLRLLTVPSDREYQQFAIDTYEKYKV